MKIKCSQIIFLFLVIILTSNVFAENLDIEEPTKYYNGNPILDNTIIPGFVLYECKYCFVPVLERGSGWEIDDISVSSELKNTNKVKRQKEIWATMPHKEFLKQQEKLGVGKVQLWYIMVIRYSFGSHKDANLFASALKEHLGGVSEGSFSKTTIGEKCWTNKDSHQTKTEKSAYGYINNNYLFFLKGDDVITIQGLSGPRENNPNPMTFEFVEKVARAIDSKLK